LTRPSSRRSPQLELEEAQHWTEEEELNPEEEEEQATGSDHRSKLCTTSTLSHHQLHCQVDRIRLITFSIHISVLTILGHDRCGGVSSDCTQMEY
jgi:hypothetical protein